MRRGRKNVRKWLIRGAVGAVALAAVAAGTFFGALQIMAAKFAPPPPVTDFPPPADALEAQNQDVSYFAELIALDRSFSAAARAETEARIAELLALDTPLHPARLRVAFHRIAALADNGHTGIFPNDGGRPNALPVKVTLFPDGLYVMRVKEEAADLLGARVEGIEGTPIADVLTALEELQGGEQAWRILFATNYITSADLLYGAGLARNPERSIWTFLLPDGSVVERDLEAERQSGEGTRAIRNLVGTRWLSPQPPDNESEGWRALAASESSLPIGVRDFGNLFRRFWVGDSCVLTAQLKVIGDAGPVGITDFLAAMEDEMRDRPPCALILDLRFNSGGNYMTSYGITQRLPELMPPDRRVYVLTAPQTFSASITTTAFVKQAMGARAVILGEPVGDRLQFWAEGGSGCLPNLKICLSYATGFHDYQNPCREWDKCFWLNWFYPVQVDTLEPGERIQMTFADYMAGRDPVFERAIELARAGAH